MRGLVYHRDPQISPILMYTVSNTQVGEVVGSRDLQSYKHFIPQTSDHRELELIPFFL